MSKKLIAHIALLLANLIYGINYTVAKDVMPDYMHPIGLVFLRVSGAFLLLWIIQKVFIKEMIARRDILKLCLCGLFGVAVNQMLFLYGLNLTTPIDAAIMVTSIPISALIFAVILGQETLSVNKIIGIFLGCIGALTLIVYGKNFSFDDDKMWGNICIVINATSYALYLVLVKPLMKKYHPITVITWVFLFGLIFVTPFGIQPFLESDFYSMPTIILWEILFVVLGTTFLAYLLNIVALERVSSTVVSTYVYLQPVIATIVALIVESDSLDSVKLISSALVFLGVYFVSKRS